METVPKAIGPLHQTYPARETLSFLILADAGSGNEHQEAVAHAMEKLCLEKEAQLDGILMLGDNFYPAGVNSIQDSQWESKMQKFYSQSCLKKLPIFPILGNHDYKSVPQAQVDYSLVEPRWKMPHRFYDASFGSLLKIIAFDSSYPDLCFAKEHCSVDFLRHALDDSNYKWKIVLSHHPLTSSSKHGFQYRGGLMGMLLKPLICNKANIWFSGHSHHLEYRRLDGCQTDFVVAGGGGGDLYRTETKDDFSLFTLSSFGFVLLDVLPTALETTFYNQKGDILKKVQQAASY